MLRSTNTWTAVVMLSAGNLFGGPIAAQAAASGSEHAEIAAVRAASVAPEHAIKVAESATGGHALGFGYERDSSTNAYEVTVSTSSGLQLIRINPQSGAVEAKIPQSSDAMAGDGLPANALDRAANAPEPLTGAVAAAEQMAGGRALEANYVRRPGGMSIDVDVAREGVVTSLRVNPATGRVTPIGAESRQVQGSSAAGQNQEDQD